jgi:hypothetical protein
VLRRKLKLEKYALTKPLPHKRNDQRWKNFADAEEKKPKRAKEGRWND